jgi:DNA-binding NtrC family response regulator
MANILLIDDDEVLADFLQEDLKKHGYRVTYRDQVDRVLEELRHGSFDVVLYDFNMRPVNGNEFLEALKKHGLKLPVILMTGETTAERVIQAMNLGAFGFVPKPEMHQALFSRLEPLIVQALSLALRQPDVCLPPTNGAATLAGGVPLKGTSPKMVEVYRAIGQLASLDLPVLIRGETGTGKELVAQACHTYSPRKDKLFVALNCAALNKELLAVELFGCEPRIYTGGPQDKPRKGIFENADGGTVFLDEIGDMPPDLQPVLLRVLETQQVRRVGGYQDIKINVRVLSATNRDLEAAIQAGQFRADLFYRLGKSTIQLPPLREHMEDLPELCAHYLTEAVKKNGCPGLTLAEGTLDKLRSYHWPGNIREFRNVLEQAVAVCRGSQVLPADVDLPTSSTAAQDETLAGLRQAIRGAWNANEQRLWPRLRDLLERELIQFAMRELKENQTEVAERLGMARGTVNKRWHDYGIKRNG